MVYAVDNDTQYLSKLQPLMYNDLTYAVGIQTDSILSWEKKLQPSLEKKCQYDLLFQLKLMEVKAYLAQGNISLALNSSQTMYQKAKEMHYSLGIALSLQALGYTYLSSSTPQEAIKPFEEALKILQKQDQAHKYTWLVLSKLVLIKLRAGNQKDIPELLRQLESIHHKHPDPVTETCWAVTNAFYYIQTNPPQKALERIRQAEQILTKHAYNHNSAILHYLYASYYLSNKQYNRALEKYDTLLNIISNYGSFRHIQLLQERTNILALAGKTHEACLAYEKINGLKDSLNAQSYSRQINELHTLYQIDQKEIENQSKQQKITYWILGIILLIITLVMIFILRIKAENKHLLILKKEQEEAKQKAEASIRTKSLFLSNMSHEIRTPLNALSGFSSILTEASIDNDTRKQCTSIIQQNSDLLLKLINDVIDLSNLEIGKMEFNFNECDAVDICRNVVDMVDKIKQTNAAVVFTTSLTTLKLTTDSSRLQQILINLLINATKFTTQGSITLTLEKTTDEVAVFSVTDTGCGIPKEKQGDIFNRFEKLNENAQGTGLGLSICQLIIEQLGGEIRIDPQYTEGTRFIFTHPIANNNKKKGEDK